MIRYLPLQTCCLLAVVILALIGSCLPVTAEGGSKKIVLIRANYKPDPDSAMIDQFKATLSRRGYREGENIEYVDIFTNKPDKDVVRGMMEEITRHSNDTALYVTSGWITRPVRKRFSANAIPQLFSPVLREEALTMLPSLNSAPGTNLSGVYLNYPPEKILRLVRLILPNIHNYAFVYDSRISTDLIMKNAFERLPEADRHGMIIHFLDLADGTEQVVPQMHSLQVGAYGGIIGAYKEREVLAKSALPMITALLMDISQQEIADRIREGNILAGLFAPLNLCGEQTGEMAADILDHVTTIDQSVPRPARQIVFANLPTAERFKIHIPFAALEGVDLVIK